MEFKVYLQQSSFIQTEFTLHSYSAQLILWMVNNRNWRAAHSWVGEHWFEFATDGFYHHGWWATAPHRRSLVMIVTTTRTMMISQWWKPLSHFLPIFQNIMTFLHCWWESGPRKFMYSNFFGELQWRFSLLSCRPCLFPIISAHMPTWPAMYSWKHFESVKLPLRHFLVVIIFMVLIT